ncbi:bifunctional demethylmenaquinone methyltransferase/2-methoxy-6-polyprenyl-1,4-benzoquinol methylase UbiE [Candidatus Riesia pediculischaeffi]|uniref:Ubiquinone/menaquinone biosynthesis C-methyltransferase UbiE n=1 Tax=Candidatus Riesia pediculischaeffi PTSU TaxID=1401651 RepID=A0A0C1VK48_9ENTR|nr:bifunctional demethylmenaquinone methyltransferase/2-methoxy-6-polyprenyl-1,4-benzoquinol methylase UbiE [Candidatus Riesia pediculischaeffi]KIE64235.1 Ubiquinone/menaquinone biosynthesis methyltransferase UbiE [Candidatus Riesia pediculischaeffi PTSU]
MFNKISDEYIKSVFDHAAKKYDVMNDIMSVGMHRMWKNFMVKICNPKPHSIVLDLAGGTGDLTIKFAQKLKDSGKIFLVDSNKSMLTVGKKKIRNFGLIKNIYYIQASAENLPFANFSFDVAAISFGLRNMCNQEKSLRSVFRVLRTGGKLVILEFSKPYSEVLKKLYSVYSFSFPYVGLLLFNNSFSYRYLIKSVQTYYDQKHLKKIIRASGFNKISHFNLLGGIASIHVGFKTTLY